MQTDTFSMSNPLTSEVSKVQPSDVTLTKVSSDVTPPASFFALFRFATTYDYFLMSMGVLCGCVQGAANPLFTVIFGDILDGLNAGKSVSSIVPELCLKLGILAIGTGIGAFFQFSLLNVSSVRQSRAMRLAYIKALFRQEIAYHDRISAGEASSRLIEDCTAFEEGISAKAGMLIDGTATFIAGFVIAFTYSWKMSLVLLGFLPFLSAIMMVVTQAIVEGDKDRIDAYAEAGNIASEALSNIRTVQAYAGESTLSSRYESALTLAEKAGVKKSTLTGFTLGLMQTVMFSVYGICMMWGAKLVIWSREDNFLCTYDPSISSCFTGGTVLQVLFALMIAAGSIGQCAPAWNNLTNARAAAGRIFALLDRVPPIDSSIKRSKDKIAMEVTSSPTMTTNKRGLIEFRNVTFAYPTRPTVNVLTNFSLKIEPGERVALVGPSGCSKSTIVALIQRWYDVNEGSILLDGIDVRDIPVQELRKKQALVSQESLLLSGSIGHNISLGAVGLGAFIAPDEDAIRSAATAANASVFIEKLPKGFETDVSNSTLSGGQRQRVCIARALLREHADILLLDEATSALDTKSERVVQAALDALLVRRTQTTITIAHRLSTIDNADRVIVMSAGQIVESGSPAELVNKENGIFKAMQAAQGTVEASDQSIETSIESTISDKSLSTTKKNNNSEESSSDDMTIETITSTDSPLATPKDKPIPWSRVVSYNAPEMIYAILGLFSCVITGLTMPAFSLILARFIAIYYNPNNDEVWTTSLYYMIGFIAIGFANLGACTLQQYCFGIMGERLVRRVRSLAFGSLLRFEISWHDLHKPGAVSAALGSDANLLKGATGVMLAVNVQNMLGLLAGCIIAFVSSWRITLIVLTLCPLMVAGAGMAMTSIMDSTEQSKKAFEGCGAVATESLAAARTVAAYGLQDAATDAFEVELLRPAKQQNHAAWMSGLGMGLMLLVMLGLYAVIFAIGAIFIDQGLLNFQDLMQALFGVIFAAMGLGNSQGLMIDATKASLATVALFRIIDRKPLVPSLAKKDKTPLPTRANGAITFKDVSLSYPGRPLPALTNVNLDIAAGSLVALVGSSGCGKTSLISLLERFYEPSSGSVCLDNVDLRELPIEYTRSQLSWVQQEPNLFDSSIAYNVGFPSIGPDERDAKVIPEALLAAVKACGADTFVDALPEKYATKCGSRGTQLSGGQKQRLCIARALLRDAPVLLLDEATSALDTVSEKLVQESIDALIADKSRQKTVIVIAHRLSTIRGADVVIVMESGKVKESGSFLELSEKKDSSFRAMLALQGLAS